LLIISKKAQFNDKGEVVIGQCEHHTDGWRLRIYKSGAKADETLYEGTYYECREIQLQGIGKTEEEIWEIVENCKQNGIKPTIGMDETALGDEDTQMVDAAEIKKSLADGRPKAEEFSVEVKDSEDAVIVRVAGNFLQEDVGTFSDVMLSLLDAGKNKILLDLGSVTTLSTKAIRKLVALHDRCREEHGRLKICNLQKIPGSTIENMHLATFFEIYPEEPDALSAFEKEKDEAIGGIT